MRLYDSWSNPRIKLRKPAPQPITAEEYRRRRGEVLHYIARHMATLMIITNNRPKQPYQGQTAIAVDGVRHQIAFRQTELAHLRKRRAATV